MWAVVTLMIFMCTPAYTNATSHQCAALANTTFLQSQFNNCDALRNKSMNIIETSNERHSNKPTTPDISYNDLKDLGSLSDAIALQEVSLGDNTLKTVMLIIHTSQSPASVFHVILVNLTVECQCELVSSIMNGSSSKYSKLSEMCQMSPKWTSLKDFHGKYCGNQYLALYIVLPILAIALIAGSVALYMWKWKRSSTSLENKGAADKSPAHGGQSRYTSRTMEGTATTLSQDQRQDYENVFAGHLRTTETKPYGYLENKHEPSSHGRKNTAEDDIYLESDANEGEQPIYTNTQGVYYNYSEPSFTRSSNREDDDVYILPDH